MTRLPLPALAALLLAAPGCAPPPPPPEPPVVVVNIPAGPEPPVSTPAPSASTAPRDAGPAEVPLLPTPFHVIADVKHDLSLKLLASGKQVVVAGSHFYAELSGDELVRSARLSRGLPKTPYYVTRLSGEWPDLLVIQLYETLTKSRGRLAAYRFRNTGWQPLQHGTRQYWCTWHGPKGQVGMVVEMSFEQWGGPKVGKLPRMPLALPDAPPVPDGSFGAVRDVECLPDGHVVAVADGPELTNRSLVLAVWRPGEELPRTYPVPRPTWQCDNGAPCSPRGLKLAARSATDVYLVGTFGRSVTKNVEADTVYLGRFDGQTWSEGGVPLAKDRFPSSDEDPDPPTPFAVAEDGTLWLIRSHVEEPHNYLGTELWKREPGGTWYRVAMPEVPQAVNDDYMTPTAVVVRAPDDVWVAATNSRDPSREFILRTKPQAVLTQDSAPVELKP